MTVGILVGSAMLDNENGLEIAVTDDNSWVVIGISAVSGDVASLKYVENMISGCKDEQVSSAVTISILHVSPLVSSPSTTVTIYH